MASDPHIEYTERLAKARQQRAGLDRRHRTLGYAKLSVGLGTALAAIWLLKYHPAYIAYFLAPAAVFVVLAVLHERVIRARRRCVRVFEFYERALARLEDCWQGMGASGEQYLQTAHPYARDLDLFGQGSLFELLCTSVTPSGQQTLASWLLAPASPAEIQDRQAALMELAGGLDFREDLAIAGEEIRSIRPEALIAWGTTEPTVAAGILRVASPLLAALWLVSLVAWGLWGWGEFALLVSFVNLGVSYLYRARLQRAAAQAPADANAFSPSADAAADDLKLVAAVLEQIERRSFSSPKLRQLQSTLMSGGVSPSRAIARLGRLAEYLDSAHNWIVRAVDPFIFWSMQFSFAIESWRKQFGPRIGAWLGALGEIEALSSLAGYAYENPDNIYPEFVEQGPLFDAEEFAHPCCRGQRPCATICAWAAACGSSSSADPTWPGRARLFAPSG